jgi:hypothetical protein
LVNHIATPLKMSEIQGLAPPDTSPDKAIPLPSAPSLPSPPHPKLPSSQTLKQWLPLYLKRTDALIGHLNRILSTPSGTDTLLMALCYSTLTTSSLLSTISLHRLHNRATAIIEQLTSLPANTTILITADSKIQAPRLLRLSQSLKALSTLISDFRIFVRLWGLLGIWKWGKSLLEHPPKDLVQKRIAWAQVVVNVAFQVLENGAYLSSKGVLGWDAKKQNKAWAWSSRFWAAHVALDVGRLAYEKMVSLGKGKGKEGELVTTNEAKRWRRQLVSNMAYAPLTVHWSLEQGIVGELWVGVLGTVAGAGSLRELWKQTAQ